MAVTIKDIAKIADVSIATVSKVVNGKTHDISDTTVAYVEKILKEQNYVPNQLARSIKTNESKTIGLIIPDIRNSFFTDIARGAEDESFDQGYSIFFASSDDKLDKEIELLNSMASKRVDGIIIAGSNERDEKREKSFDINIPAISIDRHVDYSFIVGHIATNNYEGAYIAVEHLLKNNHRRILHLAGPINNQVTKVRIDGYNAALKDYGITLDANKITYGDFSIDSGYDRIKALKEIDFTAIFAANDMIAIGAMSALNERNIHIPQDVSVIGVDNIDLARHFSPPLSTINQDAYNIGRIAAKRIIDHLKGHNVSTTRELTQELLMRSSVSTL